MPFRPEPPVQDPLARTAIVLCNLGTPDEPRAGAVRRYLAEFLGDPRVVELPAALWRPILHGIVLRVRPARSADKYASIWDAKGSPLKVWTERQAALLQRRLEERGMEAVVVRAAMRYGNPAIPAVLDALKAEGIRHVLVLPGYPQYSGTTTASVFDAVARWGLHTRHLPELRFVNRYHDDAGYLDALAERVRAHWAQHGRAEHLVMSFHGIPARCVDLGDPYRDECRATAEGLAARLCLDATDWTMTFQSRFGKARWLEPYTQPTLERMARDGVRRVDVMCPGFVSDCLETLEEIRLEVRDAFLRAGGQDFRYIDCLNDMPAWIAALADLAERHLQGWPTRR
jgi:ferrochelatase